MFALPDLAGESARLRRRRARCRHAVDTPVGDVSRIQTLSQIGAAYIVGGVVFGIALFRAGVLAQWAALLMSVGAVATVATFQLPSSSPSGCSPFRPVSP